MPVMIGPCRARSSCCPPAPTARPTSSRPRRTSGVEVVVGSEEAQTLAGSMGDRAVVVPLQSFDAALAAILELHQRSPIDAVVAVDDPGLIVATAAAERLGLPAQRRRGGRRDPRQGRDAPARSRPQACRNRASPRSRRPSSSPTRGFRTSGCPAVVKPVGLSASRGVIRADDADGVRAAATRVHDMVDCALLLEEYVPGDEVAVEGLLRDGDARGARDLRQARPARRARTSKRRST